VQCELVSIGNSCSAGFRRQSEGQALAKRFDAAPGPGLSLEQQDVVALPAEFVSRAQTAKASTNDQDALRRAFAFRYC
jgi:hypothetical protein